MPGRAGLVRGGRDVTIIANGTTVHIAAEAATALAADGADARVHDMHALNPLDEEAVLAAARETGAIVTVEAAHVGGGLSGAVAECAAAALAVPVERSASRASCPPGRSRTCSRRTG